MANVGRGSFSEASSGYERVLQCDKHGCVMPQRLVTVIYLFFTVKWKRKASINTICNGRRRLGVVG